MYNYVIVVNKGENVFVTSGTPPEQFYANTVSLLEATGVNQQDITIYLRQKGAPCIKITVPDTSKLAVPVEDQAERYLNLGTKIADAYRILHRKYQYLCLKPSRNESINKKIAQLAKYIDIVDSSVAGIEIGSVKLYEVIDVWLRKQYPPDRCAQALVVGKSTFYRWTRKLCKHLAYSLEESMTQDELHEFLTEGSSLKGWAEAIEDFELLTPEHHIAQPIK